MNIIRTIFDSRNISHRSQDLFDFRFDIQQSFDFRTQREASAIRPNIRIQFEFPDNFLNKNQL